MGQSRWQIKRRHTGKPMDEKVILLHGLGGGRLSMKMIERRLIADGHKTQIIGYPSRAAPVAVLERHLQNKLPKVGKLHFVGHSLGGVLALKLAMRLPQERRGRIVQLGAPNLGSPMAARMKPFQWWFGPTLDDLKHPSTPPTSTLDIGAIAGTIAPDFCRHLTGIEGENDTTVSVKSAFAAAAEDKQVKFRVQHTLMLVHPGVIDAVSEFLRFGRFGVSKVSAEPKQY